MGRFRRALGVLALGYLLLASPGWGETRKVDLALILAIDVSGSVNEERWRLQRLGYETAFKSAEVIQAITSGQHKAIAVTMVEWAGQRHQKQVIDWTIVSDETSAVAFASAMLEAPRVYTDWTSISGALDFCVPLFDDSGVEASRKVIDVSGDGVNNQGRPLDDARAEAVAKGIIINGLAILSDYEFLDEYYQEHVVGGPGAFMVVVKDYSSFAQGVQAKLVREIVDNDVRARSILAQRAAPLYSSR
ncbi:MAG TPA: DUF1194 domain-containing protein [Stellaceae bacterium]|nr:DUF1194 domain-containing protein [Stellaceae bacterium]